MAPASLVVSVHDVAPATASAARPWAAMLTRTRIPLTFLVVPGPWRGAGFTDGVDRTGLAGWLRARQQQGDEVCVHGWCHRADAGHGPRHRIGTLVARGAAEFWTLDRPAAANRTAAGLAMLDRHGLAVSGTTPPGWLAGAPARQGMADAGLVYCTDHAGLTHLLSGRRWRAPALCHRPATPSPDRPRGAPSRVAQVADAAGRRVVGAAPWLVRAGGSVRIGLHPDDLDRPGLAEATLAAVHACLDAGAAPTTYGDVARRMRDPQ
jgi:uncharacterized protein